MLGGHDHGAALFDGIDGDCHILGRKAVIGQRGAKGSHHLLEMGRRDTKIDIGAALAIIGKSTSDTLASRD